MITYSINAHPVIALMFSQTGTDVLPCRNEGSDKPSAMIEPHRIMVPTRTRTQTVGLKVRCRYHYTTAAHNQFGLGKKDTLEFGKLFSGRVEFLPPYLNLE